MENKHVEKVLDLLHAMPDISELTMSPRIFDDTDDYDCDSCPSCKDNAGDLYDEAVCFDCWKRAVTKS